MISTAKKRLFLFLAFPVIAINSSYSFAAVNPGFCTISGLAGEMYKCEFSSREAAGEWGWSNSLLATWPDNYSYGGIVYDGQGPSGYWWGYYYRSHSTASSSGPWRYYAIYQPVCTATQRWFSDEQACREVVQVPNGSGDPSNNGPQCERSSAPPPPACGNPINPGTGNKYQYEIDYIAPGSDRLRLSRTYNSSPYNIDSAVVRSFGARWTQFYDAMLKPELPQPNGLLGTCWRRIDNGYTWCESPTVETPSAIPDAVSIVRADGKKYLFNRSGFTWIGKADVNDYITASFNADSSAVSSWTYISTNSDTTERYDGDTGKLISITSRSGAIQKLTYSNGTSNDTSTARIPSDAPICSHVQDGATLPAGRLLCATDNWGRQLNFEYDATGRISKLIDPNGQATSYSYDGPSGGCLVPSSNNRACFANNLTQVTYPDGRSKTYYYNEAAQINNANNCAMPAIGNGFGGLLNSLTGIVDENGTRYATWTYDCQGRANSSQHAGGVEKVTLSYGATTAVTHYWGIPSNPQTITRNLTYTQIQGVVKNLNIDGSCVDCGMVKSRAYDANGNVASTIDWNGNVTSYSYDLSRNLETKRVEASGTPEARTISTQWHPTYRLPVKIAEPKRLTTNEYDAKGNLLKRTIQETNDASGAQGFAATPGGTAQVWDYSYNDVGQVLTASNPRGLVTTYRYDSQGNLDRIINAAGHVTSLSNYDANGRVGRIVDPNGLITELTYHVRGWLTSKSVDGQKTIYDYDGVGQLKKVTLPDGSYLSYDYDDAHRLTGMADSLGNRIVYTLDLIGNRIKEEVKDPNDALTGQVSRVYDTLNRLQQITGSVQ